MESMSWWLSQEADLAIRRFCHERINQELQEAGEESYEDITMLNEMEPFWSPSSDTIITPQEENLVDSFFNIDYEENNDNTIIVSFEEHGALDHFQDELLEDFSLVSDVFGQVDMMIGEDEENELMSSYVEDLEVTNLQKLSVSEEKVSNEHDVDKGLELVHLLLACAEAVGCRDNAVAESMLAQIWPLVNPLGDSLQRVSYCFFMALKTRLLLLQNVNVNGIFNSGVLDASLINKEEKMEAFHLLHRATPYTSFGFMAANEAISEAARGEKGIHIVDLGMEHTLQWPSLMKVLASRIEGPPKLLRITGLFEGGKVPFELQQSVNGLIQEAKSLDIHLEFNIVSGPVSSFVLTPGKLNLREDEALFVNSILHLHKYVKERRGSLKTILQAIKKLRPTLLTVVEQDANHNGPFFLRRFLESIHYYFAIFDSLEACLQRDSPQRLKIEKFHFLEEIKNIITYEGLDRVERHERADQWRRQLGRAGFQSVDLKSMSQAMMMLSIYGCDGYTLASDKGCLLLGWKGRPIMLASAWQVHY